MGLRATWLLRGAIPHTRWRRERKRSAPNTRYSPCAGQSGLVRRFLPLAFPFLNRVENVVPKVDAVTAGMQKRVKSLRIDTPSAKPLAVPYAQNDDAHCLSFGLPELREIRTSYPC